MRKQHKTIMHGQKVESIHTLRRNIENKISKQHL